MADRTSWCSVTRNGMPSTAAPASHDPSPGSGRTGRFSTQDLAGEIVGDDADRLPQRAPRRSAHRALLAQHGGDATQDQPREWPGAERLGVTGEPGGHRREGLACQWQLGEGGGGRHQQRRLAPADEPGDAPVGGEVVEPPVEPRR